MHEHVFLDKDTLRAGNWRKQIREALDRCRVVLVVMGRRWLTIMDEADNDAWIARTTYIARRSLLRCLVTMLQ